MALTVKAVTKADIPKSHSPGRERKASDFDEYIEPAYQRWLVEGKEAWNAVPFDGSDEQFNELATELARAANHAGKGKSTRRGVDPQTNEPTFFFLIRDKIGSGPRGPRTKNGEADSSEDTETVAADENDAAETNSRGRKPRRESVNA